MTDLTGFLLARIAEDEAAATSSELLNVTNLAGERTGGRAWITNTRVLAECEAKRRIVEHRALDGDDWAKGYNCAIEEAMLSLALPYADHPDYREEWRP